MEHFLATWGYLAVFVLSFISSMGLPVGAEVAIIYGGVLASGQIPNERHHLEPGGGHRRRHPGRGARVRWPATSSATSGAGPWSTGWASTCSSPTRTSTGPRPGSPAGGSPSSSSAGSSPCCAPSSPSPPAWARWPWPSSCSSPHRLCHLVHRPDQRGLQPGDQLPPRAQGLQLRRVRHRGPRRGRRRVRVLAPSAGRAGGAPRDLRQALPR